MICIACNTQVDIEIWEQNEGLCYHCLIKIETEAEEHGVRLQNSPATADMQSIQDEVKRWADKNFGPGTPAWHPLLGVCEEAGELCHAHLKGEQGIREGMDKQKIEAMKADAVGDIVVFLMHYCAQEGLDFQKCVANVWAEVKKRDWTKTRPAPFPKGGE